MREYELIFIVHPDLDENAFNEVVNKVTSWITDGGGEVTKTDIWGKRRLAYPIRKQTEGQYALFLVTMDPKFGTQMEHNLRFLEPILRYSIVAK
ncbi:MAG: 30S ribosomal protein S6 [Anaerolineales bacterium]|nr:30S ribosomal protein S6 [Anaerolineales bacterium]